jgi:hypothetical protein
LHVNHSNLLTDGQVLISKKKLSCLIVADRLLRRIVKIRSVEMAEVRSPGYPSQSLSDCIDLVTKIYDKVRRNTIDRDAAVQEIGYSGLTGASQKVLSNLSHYNLIERAGSGGIRVTELATQILSPTSESERIEAIRGAAFNPILFAKLRDSYPDGHVTEVVLKNFLKRSGFSETALGPAVRSFIETTTYVAESAKSMSVVADEEQQKPVSTTQGLPSISNQVTPKSMAVNPMADPDRLATNLGERVVFIDEISPKNYLKLVALGELNDDMMEALEDFIKRTRKRLKNSDS